MLSDIHLGSPLFKHDKELINLITNEAYDRIYMVGDVIDVWERSLKSIIKKHKDLIDAINSFSGKLIFIGGNHDPKINTVLKVFPKAYFYASIHVDRIGKKLFAFLHGHHFDKHQWMYVFTFPIHWVLERFGIDLSSVLRSLFLDKDKPVKNIEEDPVRIYGSTYDVIVMGHTHIRKILNLESCILVNCGSMTHKPGAVEYNSELDKFKIVEVG